MHGKAFKALNNTANTLDPNAANSIKNPLLFSEGRGGGGGRGVFVCTSLEGDIYPLFLFSLSFSHSVAFRHYITREDFVSGMRIVRGRLVDGRVGEEVRGGGKGGRGDRKSRRGGGRGTKGGWKGRVMVAADHTYKASYPPIP